LSQRFVALELVPGLCVIVPFRCTSDGLVPDHRLLNLLWFYDVCMSTNRISIYWYLY